MQLTKEMGMVMPAGRWRVSQEGVEHAQHAAALAATVRDHVR